MINSKNADFALILTAVIWGTGFIGTEMAIDTGASASLIIAMRFIIAGLILSCVYFNEIKKINPKTFKTGLIAGTLLFFGFYSQTLGQSMTTVSNSSFITSANVIMIPFIVWIATKKRPNLKFFILAITTMIGIAILTININDGFSLNIGDIFVLFSALCFALHISYLGVFTKDINSKQLTFLQMSVAGILALIFMLVFDRQAIDFDIIAKATPSVTYLAVFSSCICYYIQTTAQKFSVPSKAGIILCMEGFFGSLFAVILGYDALTLNLFFGGIIIITSVIASEIDFKKK